MNRGLALHISENIVISTSRVDVRFDRIFDDLRVWVKDNDHLMVMQLVKRSTGLWSTELIYNHLLDLQQGMDHLYIEFSLPTQPGRGLTTS